MQRQHVCSQDALPVDEEGSSDAVMGGMSRSALFCVLLSLKRGVRAVAQALSAAKTH